MLFLMCWTSIDNDENNNANDHAHDGDDDEDEEVMLMVLGQQDEVVALLQQIHCFLLLQQLAVALSNDNDSDRMDNDIHFE